LNSLKRLARLKPPCPEQGRRQTRRQIATPPVGAPASCSPDTVASKLRRWASDGMFNTFFGEFNFGNLPEDCLLRSINLFGREVIPALRDFEPF